MDGQLKEKTEVAHREQRRPLRKYNNNNIKLYRQINEEKAVFHSS
jgi:hypothetical protein